MLDPQIQKMRDLATFNDQMSSGIVAFVQLLLGGDASAAAIPAPAEAKLEALVKALDVALSLDYLKTWQAGLNNDFSMYRRAIQVR
jgi:CYRIA/CYRIB Rac1 binding domain